jgi:hypothetical protein
MPWREWIDAKFSAYTTAPMAPRHERVWEWAASLQPGVRTRPVVECWPRGSAKSTTAELVCTYLADSPSPRRRFALYVSNTQEQANSHVASISAMLEHAGIGRMENRYGKSRGWTRTLLRTNTGFSIMAFGLDTGMRGIKLDRYRPDLIIFDDIDDRHDTEHTVNKKIETITTSILPAESADAAVIVIQNKIHANSIMARLCDGTADFLLDRLPANVEVAVEDFAYTQEIVDGEPVYTITNGTATWDGQSIATCQQQMQRWGLGAFEREALHEVDKVEGGLWNKERDIAPFRATIVPRVWTRIVVAIDPSTTAGGDATGIVVAALSYEYDGTLRDKPHAYILDDATIQGSPKTWAEAAVSTYNKWGANMLVAERNNGGEMVEETIKSVPGAPSVTLVWASKGKITRAEPVQKLYEDGRVHHVGTFPQLEREMCTYVPAPGVESPNRMDALVWAVSKLMVGFADMSRVVTAMEQENEDLYA